MRVPPQPGVLRFTDGRSADARGRAEVAVSGSRTSEVQMVSERLQGAACREVEMRRRLQGTDVLTGGVRGRERIRGGQDSSLGDAVGLTRVSTCRIKASRRCTEPPEYQPQL